MMDPCSLVSNREVCEVEWRGKGVGNREGRKEESQSRFGYNTGVSLLLVGFCTGTGLPVVLPKWVLQVQVWCWTLAHRNTPLGFRTGNPRVGNWHTVPAPADTVPVTGTGTPRPVNRAVLHETRGTLGTRGCVPIHSHVTTRKQRTRQVTCTVCFVRDGWWMWAWCGLPW